MQGTPRQALANTIQEITYATTEQELFGHLLKAVRLLEFDHFAYGTRIASPVTKPCFKLNNNYAQTWQLQYLNNNYLAIDPTVKHGLTSTRALWWDETLKQQEQEFWQEASMFGLKSGWAQSSILNTSAIGMLTVSRDSEHISTTELADKHVNLVWLNDTFKSVYTEIVLQDTLRKTYTELTVREIEVLKWCADGKTSEEMSIILNIQKRTVDFHITNVIKKLNVSNKTAAAVRAIQLNIL